MFEAAEVGRKVPKKAFDEQEPQVHVQLLEAQRALRAANVPVIVIVSGVEGAGKGEVVNRLNEWLDTRGIRTHAFWDETDEERERPRYWRFWRALPPRGTIGIMFGSWYTRPIIDRVYGATSESAFDDELARIAQLERTLTDDGALIVKFWFHLSKKAQHKRLKKESREQATISPLLKKFSKRYDKFARVSERALRGTDTGHAPWYIVEAVDRRYRDLTVGRTLLAAVRGRLGAKRPGAGRGASARTRAARESLLPDTPEASVTVLDHLPAAPKYSDRSYRRDLTEYQRRLNRLAWEARAKKRFTVAVLEGWDAAGKGGAIRRVTAAMDARLYQVISVAAPTDEERAQHYLWRFWRHIPRAGFVTIYDRSWYGRVLVERVEEFARPDEWMRAYQEINSFEEQLCEHGMVVLKFWIHLSPEEQLRRFREREQIEYKRHKITEEDWRNREKWDAYKAAVNDMVARTSTEYAPWTLVPGDNKRYARVQVLKTFCSRLEEALG